MQNLLPYVYPLGCAIILLIFGNLWATISSELSEPSIVEFIPEKETVSEKMERKRKILQRGCSMISTLFEMSTNGTAYDDLLTWHARIHDLDYSLSPSDDENCYPPLTYWNQIIYLVPGEPEKSLFCLPPKCGTTSYQRALSQYVLGLIANPNKTYDSLKQLTYHDYAQNIKTRLHKKPYSQLVSKGGVEKIGQEKISSNDLHAPDVYGIMEIFADSSFVNPSSFVKRNKKTVPIYPDSKHFKKRVVNTRNPFSRLNAAWRDKYRDKWYKPEHKVTYNKNLDKLKPFADLAELPGTVPPPGYIHSFHAFLRYVNQESGESHLNTHWKSISLMCQPCRIAYDYIMDIETAQEDSQYVFEALEFDTRLPYEPNHTEVKGGVKKTLEDYYADIPKSLIKKTYAKYFLDFVLLGFSTDSVQAIVDAGTDEPSDYSYKSYQGFNSSEFNQYDICNDPDEMKDKFMFALEELSGQ